MKIVNKEYIQLQENIQALIEKWSKELQNENLTNSEEVEAISQFPAIPQLSLTINTEKYHIILSELFSLLKEHQNQLSVDLQKLEDSLTNETLEKWFKEAITVNQYYFTQYADELGVAQWLPFFVAEQGIRPYLQRINEEIAPILKKSKDNRCCPSCGEPNRLALINKEGKKVIACPRCNWTWQGKKVKCAHCGNDKPGGIEVLKVEKDERAQIYVCHNCKGYTKVIDTRALIKKESPSLLDINTIYLDYIAQENGYGIPEEKEVH